jgi:outer membrane protein assembly factor BamB
MKTLASGNSTMKKHILSAAVAWLVGGCLVFGVETQTAPSWPEFHGTARENRSPETGLLKRWPEGGPRLIWKYDDCGWGYSGVSVADGKIFTVGDDDGEQEDGKERLIALTLDGELVWKAANGPSWTGSTPGSRTTPTFRDGVLYHLNPSGRLAALRAESGEEIWAVDLKKRFDARFGVWALAENLVVEDDKVLCLPGGSKALAAALDRRTGKTLWTTTGLADKAAYCSPVVLTHNGVRQMITMTDRSVIGVDVKTGKLLWHYPYPMNFPQHATTPVYHEGHVFVACGHSTGGTLLRIGPKSQTVEKVWHKQDFDNCHTSVILLDGRLYGSGCRLGGKSFFCVDFLSGKTIAADNTLEKLSITYADDMLYGLNHKGRMHLLEITDDGVEPVSRFDLPGRKRTNGYLSHPVICDGRLYLRHENSLYVHDVRAK